MRYLVTISYDGSKFYGFQRQNNKITVQGEIEKALSKFFSEKITIVGSSRTDRGVHAIKYIFHFDLNYNVTTKKLKQIIDNLVGNSIYVKNVENVSKDFNARFSSKQKTYLYIINIGEYDPINKDYINNLNYNLNIHIMKKAAKKLIGSNSYINFVSGKRKNYETTIKKIKISKKNNIIYIEITGTAFYKYMIRNIVGSLIYIGLGRINITSFSKLIGPNRTTINYATAPACGLYLKDIIY